MTKYKSKCLKLAAALAVTLLGVNHLPTTAEAVYMHGPRWDASGDRRKGTELHHWNFGPVDVYVYDWNANKGDAQFRMNLDALMKLVNDPSVGNITHFLTSEMAFLDIKKYQGSFLNGQLYDFLGYVRLAGDSLTIDTGQYALTPLLYMDKDTKLFLTNKSKGSPGMAMLIESIKAREMIREYSKYLPDTWLLGAVKRMGEKQLGENVEINIDGGMLVQGLDATHTGNFNMSSGDWVLLMQNSKKDGVFGNTIKDTGYNITGGTITNTLLSSLYIDGGNIDNYRKFGTLNILDVPLLSSGMTEIGSVDAVGKVTSAGYVDWQGNYLTQGHLTINKWSGFKTSNIENIHASIVNNGYLDIYGDKGKQYENSNSITTNVLEDTTVYNRLGIHANLNNTADIKQKIITIDKDVTFHNEGFIFGTTIITNQLDNAGLVVLQDDVDMTVAKVGTLGNIDLVDGADLTAYADNVSGNISAVGSGKNTFTLRPDGQFQGTINIGAVINKTGELEFSRGYISADSKVNIYDKSKLTLNAGAQLHLNSNDIYDGSITINEATLNYDRANQGNNSKLYLYENGTLTVGNGHDASVLKLNGDSLIKASNNIRLGIQSNSQLVLNGKDVVVNIDICRGDVWNGTVLLNNGSLNLLAGTDSAPNVYTGLLNTQAGELDIRPKTVLDMAAGNSIDVNTKVDISSSSQLKINQNSSVTLNGGAKNIADHNGGLVSLNGGSLEIRNMKDFSDGNYEQTAGSLTLVDSQLFIYDRANYLINGGTVHMSNSTLDIRSEAPDITNRASIQTMNGKNTLKVNAIYLTSRFEFLSGSYADLAVNLGDHGEITLLTDSQVKLAQGSTWDGTIKLQGDRAQLSINTAGIKSASGKLVMTGGELRVNADYTITTQDQINGGKISIADSATLNNVGNINGNLLNYGKLIGDSGKIDNCSLLLNFKNATIKQDTININGTLGTLSNDNKADGAITVNNMTISDHSKLYSAANALDIVNGLNNAGIYYVSGGSMTHDVRGTGSMVIEGQTSFTDNSIQQHNLDVGAALNISSTTDVNITGKTTNNNTINNAGSLNTVLSNNGAINGVGNLTLHGSSYNSDRGTIAQDRLVIADGSFVNKNTANASLSASAIQVNQNATMHSSADALQLNNNGYISNAGTVKLIGGKLDASIKDLNNTKGSLYIDGNVTLAKDSGIESKITVSRGNTLTVADAKDIIYGADNNLGKVILQGGTIASGVVIMDQDNIAHGTVVIDGNVTNQGTIKQHVTINQDKGLISDIAGLTSSIDNAGKLYLSGGEIKTENTISGSGDLFIQDDMRNHADITQGNIYITENKTFTNTANITATQGLNFSGVFNNQGTVTAVLNNVSTLTNGGSGRGILNIMGNSQNAVYGDIKQQQVNLDANASLKNDGKITAALDSQGKITGSGEITLTGDSFIGASVSNKINNLVDTQKLTISGQNVVVSGEIINDGTIAFEPRANGIEINANISGTSVANAGRIELNAAGRVVLNATASNQNIDLNNGTLVIGSQGNLNGSNITLGGVRYGTDYGSGRLDLSTGGNGAMRDVTIGDFTVNTDRAASGILIDVDLEGSNNDRVLVAGIASSGSNGELNLHAINIVKDFAEGTNNTTITIVDTTDSGTIDSNFKIADATIASDSGKYQFTQNATSKGKVDVNKVAGGITLLDAIRDTQITSYSLTKNDYSGQLDLLAGGRDRNLTIFGNNHTISGNNASRGLTVDDGQELVIKDATITGYKATSDTDGFAITNKNITYLEGVNLIGNQAADGSKLDILNTGELHFQDKNSTLDGGIIGTGDMYISGAGVDVLTGGITQENLTISVSGGLSIGAANLHISDDLTNNGVLKLQDGALSQTIKGDGDTYIAGNVQVGGPSINIEQDIYVMAEGTLHIDPNSFTKNIDNNGRLVMNNGVLTNNQIISGNGTLQITGHISNSSFISQGRVEIDTQKTLSNTVGGGLVVSKELLNKGTFINDGNTLAQLNNQAEIKGTGKLTIAGASKNAMGGTIAQDELLITEGVFTNENTHSNAISSNTGINITDTGAFVTDATAIGSQVNNNGVFKLVGGTLAQLVDGTGTVLIEGNVVNDTTIKQAGVFVQTGTLTNTLGRTIDAQVAVADNGTLNSSVDDILQTVYNDGTYNITAGQAINRDILGTGQLNIGQNMQNNADILQGVVNLNDSTVLSNQGRIQATLNIATNATLNSTATNIMGKVNNDGVYNVQGGLIGFGYDINGSGTLNILENTLNKAVIKQALVNVNANNIFSSDASNIQTKVANQGTYQVTGGNIRYDVIGGGSLQVIDGAAANEANINQQQVVIESKLTNSAGAQIVADELTNIGTLDNNGRIISNLKNGGVISGNGHMELHGESLNATGATLAQASIDLTADNELFNFGKISANQLTVNQGALLSSNADGIAAKVFNSGAYRVDGGTIGYDITTNTIAPSGQVFIVANAVNKANITQKDLLNNQDITFDNRGNITVQNLLQNDGQMLNSGLVVGDLFNNEHATLNSNGVLNIELSNLGTVNGTGRMQLHGVSVNNGTISHGYIAVSGEASWLLNNNNTANSITAILLSVGNKAGLQANADSINTRVANDGTYNVQGGTIHQEILGKGSLNILLDTTNNAAIHQENIYLDAGSTFTNNLGKGVTAEIFYIAPAKDAQEIDDLNTSAAKARAVLVANATDINSKIYNEGLYRVQGGNINNDVVGSGDLYIQGAATNNALIAQTNVAVEQAKSLTNNSNIIADALSNQGLLTNNGLVLTIMNNQGTINGNGSIILSVDKDNIDTNVNINSGLVTQNLIELSAKGTLNNSNLITAQVFNVNKEAILNSSADNLLATVQNNGTYNLSGGTIYRPIIGQGTLNLQLDTLNLNSVSQGLINIDSGVNIRNEGIIQTPDMEKLLAIYAADDILGSKLDDLINSTTGSTDGNIYSIKNNGNILSNGLILGSINNQGNISGAGLLYLVGTSTNAATVSIDQSMIYLKPYATLDNKNESYRSLSANLITIQEEGVLTSNAYAVGAPLINDGVYNIVGSANKSNVIDYNIFTNTGRGQININVEGGRVVNDANILQAYVDINYGELFNNEGKVIVADLEISEDSAGKQGVLTANASNIIGRINNRGIYNIQGAYDGGIIAYSITGSKTKQETAADGKISLEEVYAGELNIKGSTIAEALIVQDKVNISANVELTNNATIYANSLFNRGIVQNNTQIEAQISNYGLIDGAGTILAKDGSKTYGDILNDITIDKNATLTVAGYAELSGHITNNSGSTLKLDGNTQGVILSGGVSTNKTDAAAGSILVNKNNTTKNRATIQGNIFNQNINVEYGTLNLVENTRLDRVNLELFAGTLSIQDKSKSIVNLDSLVATGGAAKLNFDLGDRLAINSTSGTMQLGSVLLDTTLDYSSPIELFTNQTMDISNTVKTFTNKAIYEIKQDTTDKHYLNVAKQAINPEDQHDVINLAINELNNNSNSSVTLQVSGDLLQDKDIFVDLQNQKSLVIAADIQSAGADRIIGKQVNGLRLSAGSELVIRNIKEINGFSADSDTRKDGGFADNNGSIIITSEYSGQKMTLSNNYAREYGGSIANHSSALYGAGTIFTKNIVGLGGGALSNYVNIADNARSELAYTTYSDNKAGYSQSGAVNAAQDGKGGAFYNYTADTSADKYSAVADLNGATFQNNTATAMGGAVYNASAAGSTGYAVIRLNNTVFTGNSAMGNGASGQGLGGAIYNGANGAIWSDYLTSAADIIDDILSPSGVSKFKAGEININSAQFISNTAKNDGGAIYNDNTAAVNLTDVWFINNTAVQGRGGAIYTKGNTVSITASTVNVDIHGNTANGISNAIYFECTDTSMPNAVLNLDAQNSKLLVLDDAVQIGNVHNPTIINMNTQSDSNGTIILGKNYKLVHNDNSFYDTEYVLDNGKLYLESEANFSGNGNNNLTMESGTTLSSINHAIGNISLNKLTTTGVNPYISLGVDLGANEVDQLLIRDKQTIAPGTIFNIGLIDVSLVPDTLRNSYGKLANLDSMGEYALDGSLDGKIFSGKIFDRKLTMSNDTLNLEFIRFNPSILAASVATQGTYLTQLNSYEQVFENMEPLTSITADKRAQIKAHAAHENTLWFKMHSSYEDMLLDNGPRAKSNIYGGILGIDSPIQSYANAWDAIYSIYAGFNAVDNTYEGSKIKQNGINVGAAATFFKGNFYTALTANVGYNNATADNMFGSDKFHTTSFGIAAKAGYNIETGKFTIQPNLQVSYTNIGTADYQNAAGLALTSSRTNAVQIAPGVKIMANLNNGWKPYVSIQRVWTHGGATSFSAADVLLPSMSVKPYYQYNIGLQKDYGDKFSGSASFAMRNGSRKGVAFQANLRWMF